MRSIYDGISGGLERLSDDWVVKALIGVIAWMFFGDDVAHVAYVSLGVLLLLDLATGIMKARKLGTFDSRSGRFATIFKFVNVFIVFASARMADVIVSSTFAYTNGGFVKAMIVYIAAHELKSIDENLVEANGIGLTAIIRKFVDPR